MKNISKEPTDTHWYGRPTAMIIALGVIIFFGVGVIGMMHSYREAKTGRDRIKNDLDKIHDQSAHIEEDLGKLATPRGQEEEFRTKYRAVKEGEQLIVVVPPDDEKGSVAESPERQDSWWHRLVLSLKRVF